MTDGRTDHEATAAILDEAARFAERHLTPLAAMSGIQGSRMAVGRVKTSDGGRHDDLDAAFDAAFA